MNAALTDAQRRAVVSEAGAWVGTPYHHRARVRGAGVDCAMLLAEVYHSVNLIPYIDPPAYPPDWHLHRDAERYLGFIMQNATRLEGLADWAKDGEATRAWLADHVNPGDVLTHKFGRCVSHAAIVVKWPEVIHAVRHNGVIRDDASAPYWLSRFAGAWTLWPEG